MAFDIKPAHRTNRRQFFERSALATATAVLAASRDTCAQERAARFKIIGFTKPFANLSADETADLVAKVGWDGVDCPVRSKAGQIAPERVEDELPKLVEALKKHGKELPIITTEIVKVDLLAEKVLRTAARLGIKKYRLGFVHYAKNRPIPETLRDFGAALQDIAGLNRDLGLQGGYQNHSGANYVGAPIWDVWTVIKALPPEHIGMCFDIAHATIEGGLSWPIEARLMEPFFVAVFLKDFRWEQTAKGWQPQWCNFGAGAVEKSFLTNLKKSSFTGPLCQHHEYPHGIGAEMIANFKRDLDTLRKWLSAS
jgi:sugar phosphate isomerase/epimerase